METRNILDHLEKLMALEAVATAGSVRKAAESLNISQPSLSVKLRLLEDYLDVTLLERSPKGVFLTLEGQKALEFVRSVTKGAERLKTQLESNDEELSGHVKIGIYDSIARYFWPKFYKYFLKKYPDISISLHTGRSQHLSNQLDKEEIDIAFVVEPEQHVSLKTKVLYKDHFSFYCNASLAKKINGSVPKSRCFPLKTLSASTPLILFSQALSGEGKALQKLIEQHHNDKLPVQYVENFEIAHSFCLEGLGLAVLPHLVAESSFEKQKLVKVKVGQELPLHFGRHSIGLKSLRQNYHFPVVQHVFREISEFIEG